MSLLVQQNTLVVSLHT